MPLACLSHHLYPFGRASGQSDLGLPVCATEAKHANRIMRACRCQETCCRYAACVSVASSLSFWSRFRAVRSRTTCLRDGSEAREPYNACMQVSRDVLSVCRLRVCRIISILLVALPGSPISDYLFARRKRSTRTV